MPGESELSLDYCRERLDSFRLHLSTVQAYVEKCQVYHHFADKFFKRSKTEEPLLVHAELEASLSDLEAEFNELLALHERYEMHLFGLEHALLPLKHISLGDVEDAQGRADLLEYQSYLRRLDKLKVRFGEVLLIAETSIRDVQDQAALFRKELAPLVKEKERPHAIKKRVGRRCGCDEAHMNDHYEWTICGSSNAACKGAATRLHHKFQTSKHVLRTLEGTLEPAVINHAIARKGQALASRFIPAAAPRPPSVREAAAPLHPAKADDGAVKASGWSNGPFGAYVDCNGCERTYAPADGLHEVPSNMGRDNALVTDPVPPPPDAEQAELERLEAAARKYEELEGRRAAPAVEDTRIEPDEVIQPRDFESFLPRDSSSPSGSSTGGEEDYEDYEDQFLNARMVKTAEDVERYLGVLQRRVEAKPEPSPSSQKSNVRPVAKKKAKKKTAAGGAKPKVGKRGKRAARKKKRPSVPSPPPALLPEELSRPEEYYRKLQAYRERNPALFIGDVPNADNSARDFYQRQSPIELPTTSVYMAADRYIAELYATSGAARSDWVRENFDAAYDRPSHSWRDAYIKTSIPASSLVPPWTSTRRRVGQMSRMALDDYLASSNTQVRYPRDNRAYAHLNIRAGGGAGRDCPKCGGAQSTHSATQCLVDQNILTRYQLQKLHSRTPLNNLNDHESPYPNL